MKVLLVMVIILMSSSNLSAGSWEELGGDFIVKLRAGEMDGITWKRIKVCGRYLNKWVEVMSGEVSDRHGVMTESELALHKKVTDRYLLELDGKSESERVEFIRSVVGKCLKI